MVEINNFSVISKEVLTILSYCDENIINKVPSSLIKELINYAADSKTECIINPKKRLEEQNISEESKDLIALIYYSFIANKDAKEEVKKIWNINETKYQENLNNKYNIDSMFKSNINSESMDLVEYKEENFFIKFIKKLLNKFVQ